jgi:ABC-2 type transport system permease protein
MNVWRQLWLVARREWSQRVRTAAFKVSTVLSAALVVVLIAVPEIYGAGEERTRMVGVVGDASRAPAALIEATGKQLDVEADTRAFDSVLAGRTALRAGDVDVLLVDGSALVWKADPDERLRTVVTAAVAAVDREASITELGLTAEEATRLLQPPDLASSSLEPVTTEEATARADLARIGLILLFMAIAFYCGFVLTGVVEEKASRVVEVLLSRVRPTELLAGKVLGIGLVGLAQFTIVATSGVVAYRFSEDVTLAPNTAPGTLAWMVFWFVLGYAFYSVLYATVGSLVSRQEEAQSVQLPVTGVLLVAYILSFAASESPDGTAALIGSLLPPTSPMVMTVRIANGAVPWWQIALSIAVMLATVVGLVQLAGRIYAGSVLRIGRRLRWREAWHGAKA